VGFIQVTSNQIDRAKRQVAKPFLSTFRYRFHDRNSWKTTDWKIIVRENYRSQIYF